jgi:formylglycine-generating enzyme required for sulfatase activity
MTDVDRLVAVQSQLTLGLKAYLRAFVDLSAWPRSPFLGRRSMVDVYLPPDVVKGNRLDAAAIARRREADQHGEFVRADERLTRTPWASERQRIQRAVILGRPGEGKTLLTQLTCRDVAQEGLTALRQRTQAAPEIAVPIWLRVEDILVAGSVRAAVERTTQRAVDEAVRRYYRGLNAARRPSTTLATAQIIAALERSSTWLFLDALDERPIERHVDPRHALRTLADLPCRIVITGRPYAYYPSELPFGSDQVSEYELVPLRADQRRSFIVERWFSGDPVAGARVLALVEGHPQFQDMAINGLSLTLICATAERHHLDPETTRRVHLYDLAVRDMVRRAHKVNPLPDDSLEVENRLLVLPRVAWTLFQSHAADKVFSYPEWHKALLASCTAEQIADPPRFAKELTYDLAETGLLVSPASGTWMFLHRTFFEYLAAVAVAQQGPGAVIEVIGQHVSDPAWREVSILTVAHLGLLQGRRDAAGVVVDDIVGRAPGAPGEAAALMGDAVAESAATAVPESTRTRLQQALLEAMRNDQKVPARTREAAGTALCRVGDPRFRTDAWFLPNEPLLGFVVIPAGPFTMGSKLAWPLTTPGDKSLDPCANQDETPQHVVALPAYYIGRWPVTVTQFRTFANDARLTPTKTACLEGVPNHPVGSVHWLEALAYCAWLTKKLREWDDTPEPLHGLLRGHSGHAWQVTLPSEAEWEKAARGEMNERRFPWGNVDDPNRANYSEASIRSTSATGCFAGGASSYGVEELAGNVWEWTRSVYDVYPYIAGERRERLSSPWVRALRGGCFRDTYAEVRVSCRGVPKGGEGPGQGVGFRVVVSPFTSDA